MPKKGTKKKDKPAEQRQKSEKIPIYAVAEIAQLGDVSFLLKQLEESPAVGISKHGRVVAYMLPDEKSVLTFLFNAAQKSVTEMNLEGMEQGLKKRYLSALLDFMKVHNEAIEDELKKAVASVSKLK